MEADGEDGEANGAPAAARASAHGAARRASPSRPRRPSRPSLKPLSTTCALQDSTWPRDLSYAMLAIGRASALRELDRRPFPSGLYRLDVFDERAFGACASAGPQTAYQQRTARYASIRWCASTLARAGCGRCTIQTARAARDAATSRLAMAASAASTSPQLEASRAWRGARSGPERHRAVADGRRRRRAVQQATRRRSAPGVRAPRRPRRARICRTHAREAGSWSGFTLTVGLLPHSILARAGCGDRLWRQVVDRLRTAGCRGRSWTAASTSRRCTRAQPQASARGGGARMGAGEAEGGGMWAATACRVAGDAPPEFAERARRMYMVCVAFAGCGILYARAPGDC